LTQREIDALFEAPRWAPSAGNSQPWLFLYATTGPEREVLNSLLRENNRRWAPAAPLLIFVAARRANAEGRPLRTAQFDAGAAWMSLAVQACMMGLVTHAMGGIVLDQAHEKLGLSPAEYDVICAIAVGRAGDKSLLPEDLAQREKPSSRKPLAEVARPWKEAAVLSPAG
jgi:nitroreductase